MSAERELRSWIIDGIINEGRERFEAGYLRPEVQFSTSANLMRKLKREGIWRDAACQLTGSWHMWTEDGLATALAILRDIEQAEIDARQQESAEWEREREEQQRQEREQIDQLVRNLRVGDRVRTTEPFKGDIPEGAEFTVEKLPPRNGRFLRCP